MFDHADICWCLHMWSYVDKGACLEMSPSRLFLSPRVCGFSRMIMASLCTFPQFPGISSMTWKILKVPKASLNLYLPTFAHNNSETPHHESLAFAMQMHTMKMQRHQPMQLWWPWHTKVASFQMGPAPAPAASPESQRGPQQIRHPNAAQSPGHGLGRGFG